jgi:hypothetical protein
MPPRFRTSILFAFVLLFLYLIFPFGTKDVPYENGNLLNGAGSGVGGEVKPGPEHEAKPPPPIAVTKEKEKPKSTSTIDLRPPKPTVGASSTPISSSAVPEATNAASDNGLKPQDQFNTEYDALGQ